MQAIRLNANRESPMNRIVKSDQHSSAHASTAGANRVVQSTWVWLDFNTGVKAWKGRKGLRGVLLIRSLSDLQNHADNTGDQRLWVVNGATILSPEILKSLNRRVDRR